MPALGDAGPQATRSPGGTLIDTLARLPRAALIAFAALALWAPIASAATVVVDDDRAQCPNAGYTDLGDAVAAAAAGDTVAVCAGTYRELSGQNGLVIGKPLTIRGAGADQVEIQPQADVSGTLPSAVRTAGNVVLVDDPGGRVDISGVTISSGGHYAEGGVVFQDATGSLTRSRVTDLDNVPSYDVGQGVGVYAYADEPGHEVEVSGDLIEQYGKGAVIVRSPTFVLPAVVEDNAIHGQGATAASGHGQNGVQVRGAGARATIRRNEITGHRFTPDESASVGVLLFDTEPGATVIGDNDLQNNGYGVFNADSCGHDATDPVEAAANWWGDASGPTRERSTPPGNCADYTITDPPPPGGRVNGDAVTFAPFRTSARGATTPLPARQDDAAPAVSIDSPADGAEVAPDSSVTVTAGASDDFDVKRVEFLRGGTLVATDTTSPYSATITSPGAGSSTSVTARAVDSSDQVGTRSIALRSSGSPAATTPSSPAETDDRPPTVAITSPTDGATVNPSAASRITAQATDDHGVSAVAFLDDGKVVCRDDAAPYDCAYSPTGDDVGRDTLIAIALDGAGQTAVDFRGVTVGRFASKLTAKTTPGRDRKRPYRYTTSGKLVLPPGVTPAQACAGGGTIAIVFGAGKLKLPMTAALKADCSYKTSIAFPSRRSLGRGRLSVKTSFAGNAVVGAAKAKAQKVRAG